MISRGSRAEHVPTFFAYVWAPGPEADDERRDARSPKRLSARRPPKRRHRTAAPSSVSWARYAPCPLATS